MSEEGKELKDFRSSEVEEFRLRNGIGVPLATAEALVSLRSTL